MTLLTRDLKDFEYSYKDLPATEQVPRGRLCFAVNQKTGFISIGSSFVSDKDNYSRKEGNSLAKHRANLQIVMQKSKSPKVDDLAFIKEVGPGDIIAEVKRLKKKVHAVRLFSDHRHPAGVITLMP